MTIPVKYRSGGEAAVASYDYVDVANGLGYVEFKGLTSRPAGTLTYHLSKEVIEPGYTSGAVLVNNERRSFVCNNDTSGGIAFETSAFNLPKTIKGKVFTNFTLTQISTSAQACTPTIALYNNTTLLGTCSGAALATGTPYHQTYNLSFDVTQTIIKRGDVLKLTISGAAAAAAKTMVNHDPINRDQAAYTSAPDIFPGITASQYPTELNCWIPFKIDL
jgi:hypothetical protein